MITGLRGVVLLDAADAAYLCSALDQFSHVLSQHGMRPTEPFKAARARLAKAVAHVSVSPRNSDADARVVGNEQVPVDAGPYDLVDTDEAARILGCSTGNVRDLARRGKLAGHRASGRWLYPAAAVIARSERQAKRG